MKVQAFITSGILEKYVLGMASEEESNEILEMASQHLEIKEEIAAIRKTIKGYVLTHQIAPPENLKEKVLKIAASQPAGRSNKNSKKEPKASYQQYHSASKASSGKTGLVATIVVLALGLAGAYYYINTLSQNVASADSETDLVKNEVETLNATLAEKTKTIESLEADLAFFSDPANNIFLLNGTQRSPGAEFIVYWNESNKTGFIDMRKMPSVTTGRTPILWAITNNQTIKLGVLTESAPGQLSSLTFVPNSRSFYVTEENSADVDRPNRNRILMRMLQ